MSQIAYQLLTSRLLMCYNEVISASTLTHQQLSSHYQIIKRWANCVMLAFREQGEVFHVYCCRLWHTNTHLISYFLSSSVCGPKGSENVSLWHNSGCKTFYPVDYEANRSESLRHKCIPVNHNIPCPPASPRKMTAWHHHFPSKNTAFKKVKEGVSFTQHRPLTWNPFTELGDLE